VRDLSELEKTRMADLRRALRVQIRPESADGICPKTGIALSRGMPLFERTSDSAYHYHNGYFETVDAEIAYCMIWHCRPTFSPDGWKDFGRTGPGSGSGFGPRVQNVFNTPVHNVVENWSSTRLTSFLLVICTICTHRSAEPIEEARWN